MKSLADIFHSFPEADVRTSGPILIHPYVLRPEAFVAELEAIPWWTRREARHEYFMTRGKQISYSYDPVTTYNSEPICGLIETLMDSINDDWDTNFNGVFLNKYDNERQHIGWHADDDVGMHADHPIAVVSFGAEREIWVKPMAAKGQVPEQDRYLLREGSMFIMPPGYQQTHFHRIPKHDRPCGPRMSLTFRSFK